MAIPAAAERPEARRRLDIDDHVPALANGLAGRLGLHAARQGAKRLGLDLRAWRIVQILGCDGRSTVFEIADRIAMDRGGTSRAIARLEARGIVRREEDPADRRRSLVDLTDAGWALHDESVRFSLAREERLLECLSPADRRRLREMLRKLLERAGEMLDDGWTPESTP